MSGKIKQTAILVTTPAPNLFFENNLGVMKE
jgi:hypothetical protein